MSRTICLICNAGSGRNKRGQDAVARAMAVLGDGAHRIEWTSGQPIETAIDRALAHRPEFIVAAGGDGTVMAVAGALLGRGVEKVEAVHWNEELGLAQAMWVIKCNNMGPFIVASDKNGDCLFERENAKVAKNLERVYEGTRPATLKRYGETDDRSDEVI